MAHLFLFMNVLLKDTWLMLLEGRIIPIFFGGGGGSGKKLIKDSYYSYPFSCPYVTSFIKRELEVK